MAGSVLSNNFSYIGKNPNFDRDKVSSLATLLAVDPDDQHYDYGHIVFCEEDGKHYRFMYNYDAPDEANYNDTTGWFQEFAAGTSSGGTVTEAEIAQMGFTKNAGTVTGITINDGPVREPTNGVVNLVIEQGDGGLTSESDPIFTASPAAGITADDIEAWNNKVDAVEGKGLSTNDFTTTLKNKLDGIASGAEVNVQSDWNATNGDAFIKNKPTFKTINGNEITGSGNIEIKTEGGGITSESDPIFMASPAAGITADDIEAWNNKVDSIEGKGLSTNDFTATLKNKLDGIASGAEVNVQSDWNATSGDAFIKNKPTFSAVATSGSYDDLSDKPTIPTALSQLTQSTSYRTVTDTEKSVWNNKQDAISDLETIRSGAAKGATALQTEQYKGTYTKPSTGIPESDLASAVQTSLDKAKNAFTGTVNYKKDGTVVAIDKVIMNGNDYTPKDSATHIDIGTVITGDDSVQHILGGLVVGSDETPSAMQDEKHVGRIMLTGVENPLVGLLDNSDSAVPFYLQAYQNELYVGQTRGKAIKINSSGNVTVQKALAVTNTISEGGTALSEKYQAKLVSGTNIKTINGETILGNGNIVANAYPLVSHGTSDTTFTLTPNTFHVWGIVSSLTLTFGSETEGVANEYLFQFSCSSSVATTLSLPSSVMWADGETPAIEVMKTYQVSILNNCATIQSFG